MISERIRSARRYNQPVRRNQANIAALARIIRPTIHQNCIPSPPGNTGSVTYANLAPGTYRFAARAVTDDGQAGASATLTAFAILPPIWQRWWFLSLAGAVILAALYGAHRYRTARLLEVAQMRARIATDLHDDIGANLMRIGVLSEVVRQQSGDGDSPTSVPLASIAAVAREPVASMGDIVWAINPERPTRCHLARRCRDDRAGRAFARDRARGSSGPLHRQVGDRDEPG